MCFTEPIFEYSNCPRLTTHCLYCCYKLIFDFGNHCTQRKDVSLSLNVTKTIIVISFPFKVEYDNYVHFEGVRFICDPHLVIIGPSEGRVDLMAG